MSSSGSASSSPGKTSRRRSNTDDAANPIPAKKPMFSIFDKKSTSAAVNAVIDWKTYGTSFIIGQAYAPKAGPKVAAFDLDSTLISVNGKHKWPKNADDWVWWNTSVPGRLKELADEGYILVIITNQNGLDGKVEKQKEFKLKMEKICGQLQLPMWILISMQKDHYRKPMTGLWHWLETKFEEDGIHIDDDQSYYVGDAAGRHDGWKVGAVKDFNNTDRKFAVSLGIAFHTPEHFFLNQHCPEEKWSFGKFDPKVWPKQMPLFSPSSTPLLPESGTCEVILFCGFPASGKSSFAQKHILSTGRYEYVNQDTLKSREKCIKAVDESLQKSKAVVIDNTNPDKIARAPYIALAKKHNVPIRCFLFVADKDLATHNNYFRAFHRPLIEAAQKVQKRNRDSPPVANTVTTTTSSTTTATTNSIGEDTETRSSSTTTSIKKVVTVTKVRDEPARERLSEMVFASYAKKYQEPTLAEGFSEIKKINFVPDEDIREAWERWYC
ncbi:bifunctional polynucleotide phosphatase/kinase [Entomortierella parvispora]|uniref:Bifunctional polynucleotide phosphatase/kinase n=1 Tax=Entomortierella parvispora TaxID=205924 RepID=A0A9P3HJ94_9FUNG|nr:bifunctional polynucleotide phosphatase/kinase [Entomortierella parvispora]